MLTVQSHAKLSDNCLSDKLHLQLDIDVHIALRFWEEFNMCCAHLGLEDYSMRLCFKIQLPINLLLLTAFF